MAPAVAAQQPVLLNRQQVADALSISVRYVIKLEKQGILPAKRINRMVRYLPEDVRTAAASLTNSK
jgi:hypothetical protein